MTAAAVTSHTTARELSLRRALSVFLHFPTPWVLTGLVAGTAIARVAVARWSWRDLAVVVVLVAAQPFVEWVLHVTVLHWRPRHVAGMRLDPYIARKHRAHHRAPRDLPLVFVPVRVLVGTAAVLFALDLVVLPTPALAVTAMLTSSAVTLTYEWLHYLIHSDYRPRRSWFRHLHKAHRLHHYRNERYWFGVTSTLGDRVLRTSPKPAAVPISGTAATLGVFD